MNLKPKRSLGPGLKPLITPAVFDFWARHLHPTLSWDRPLARVIERRAEAAGAVTLVLKPNRHFAGFRPGQHLNVTAAVAGVNLTRSYSLSDIPRPDGRLSITVQQVEGGRLSTQLCTHAGVGDVLELGAAYGDMTWAETPSEPWLLLAAGSGITPLMSLIRSAAAADAASRDIVLIYWARTAADLCFAEELSSLSAQGRGVRCHFVLTRDTLPPAVDIHAVRGRPNADLFARLTPDLDQRRVYACGPAGFVASVRELTAAHARSFQSEAFTPPPRPAHNPRGPGRGSLTPSAGTLELPAGKSLLEALEAQGLNPAHGCRMGICNTCVCTKQSGTTESLLSGERDTGVHPALKLCISRACDDLVLDL